MSDTLANKHIVLGVTGSIAAYKAAVLVRALVTRGADVQVVMTPAGKEFITPLTLSTLTHKPVISEFFDRRDGSWNSHVDLGIWADAMLIAPCTASTLGKMANGVADNMLITTYLSMKAPVFIAPAMDLDMFRHPSTQRNLDYLKSIGNIIIEPAEGELASKLVGKGRMEEPEQIVRVLEDFFSVPQTQIQDLSKKKLLITAGPTHERIDPVRFIGNDSSGKMGFALARECADRGAQVTLIAGPVNIELHDSRIERIDVESAQDMYDATARRFPDTDAAIFCAAVADFTPKTKADNKIKRHDAMSVELVPTKDIAAEMGKIKRAGQKTVGFALETEQEKINAQEKLSKKNFDFIVMNSLRDSGAGFGHDTNKVMLIDSKEVKELPLMSKKQVAKEIVSKLAGLLCTLFMLFVPIRAAYSQELNAQVNINTSKISGTDKDVFNELQTDMRELLNNTAWTSYQFEPKERIGCVFNLTVNKYTAGTGAMECELMVQSNRPVYNSAYSTTVFSYRDTQVGFSYTEQDRLEWNPNNIDNNLTAILAFYSYLIIGLDFDTMSLKGGTEILQSAENVVNNAQSLGNGWRSFDNNKNRYAIINDYLNGSLEPLRQLQYDYYRKGMDTMAQNVERARGIITESLQLLADAKSAKSTSALPILFTEIKKDEIINIYSKGIDKEKETVIQLLSDVNPSLSSDWNTIKTSK